MHVFNKVFNTNPKRIKVDLIIYVAFLSYYLLRKFSQEYDRIMEIADKERPVPPDPPKKKRGRKKKGKERALIERLKLLKDAVCLFIHDFKVPFDNNQALCELFIYANFMNNSLSDCIF